MIRWLLSGLLLVAIVIAGYLPLSLLWRESQVLSLQKPPYNGQFVTTSDASIYVQKVGFSEQPTVVFIHGPGMWSESWKSVMRLVAQEGYQTVALDIPPFGLSPAPKVANYTRPAQAQRLREAIDILGIKSFILVTHSYGAPAAMTAARMMAPRVVGLVLVSPGVGFPKKRGAHIPKPSPLLVRVLKNGFTRNVLASLLTHDWSVRYLVNNLSVYHAWLTPFKRLVFEEPFRYKGTNGKVSNWLAEFYLSQDHQLVTDMKFYDGIRVPTLIVWGENDKLLPVWQGEEFNARITGSQLVKFPKVGHFPHLENEKGFTDTLLHFVKSHLAPSKK